MLEVCASNKAVVWGENFEYFKVVTLQVLFKQRVVIYIFKIFKTLNIFFLHYSASFQFV